MCPARRVPTRAKIPGSARPAAASCPTQFERLTPDHVRAIFETARVDRLGEVHQWQDSLKRTYTGVDAWVAVFMDKVCQIEQRHCGA